MARLCTVHSSELLVVVPAGGDIGSGQIDQLRSSFGVRTGQHGEARFRAVVENSHDGIIFTDADGRITYRSPSFQIINGFEQDERVGRSGFETVHPDDLPMLRDSWARMVSGAAPTLSAEYRIRHKDGTWRWIETTARNLLDNPNVGAVVTVSGMDDDTFNLSSAVVTFVVAFLIVGFIIGLPGNDLAFSAAVLVATALMSVLSALRMENLVRANFFETQLLNNIAERDGLSGLYNRRMFDTLADRLWQQAQRDQQSLQVVLVDIDDFKLFNDHYGHQAGDHCIRRVATIISRAARRPLDFCARYGGEEFALVLFAPSGAEPTATGEQIRQGTLDLRIPHSHSSVAGFVSVSVGSAIATPGSKRSLAGLIQAADEALYLAKQSGRNRVLHVDADTSATRTGSFRVASAR